MKYLANDHAGGIAESQSSDYGESSPQFYTRNKDGQYELYPPPSMYQRVLAFLRDLRKELGSVDTTKL